MTAKGNSRPYTHNALDWLELGQIKLPNGWSIVWNKCSDIGITEII